MEYHVLNLGAGVQSTTVYLLACEGKYQFDVAIFADTQEEPAEVYKHLSWLQSLGGPPIWIRTTGKLGDDLISGRGETKRFVSIPAFVKRAGQRREGIVRRQCTSEYKIKVCERAIRRELIGLKAKQKMPKDVMIYQYFGISMEEEIRAIRARTRFEKIKWSEPVYPLLDLGWSRKDCLAYLKERVPYQVPRSACVFCPFKSNQEWARLKREDDDGWARAVEVDEALRADGAVCKRGLEGNLFVHRSLIPLNQIDFDKLAPNTIEPMSVGECYGMCGL